MSDRQYYRERPGMAWHAYTDDPDSGKALCGRWNNRFAEIVDRLPPDGHFCGTCSRVLAARTDIEDRRLVKEWDATLPPVPEA